MMMQDRDFAAMMEPHHRAAIEMALLDACRDGFESAFEQARSRPVLHVIFRKILCKSL